MADFWVEKQNGDVIDAADFNDAFLQIGVKIKGADTSTKEVQSNLTAHIEDKGNPHEVTAEQTGAYEKENVYNKTEIDEKLVLAGTNEEETVDLTTVTDSSEAISPEVTSSTLGASGGPFKITLDNTKSYRIKGVFEGHYSGYVQIDGNYLFNIENGNEEFTKTFDYVGSVGTITVYGGTSFICTFEEFVAITRRDGFMSASDKSKLDNLPNDAYSKHETDEKLNMLSLKGQKVGAAVRISDAEECEQTADVSIASKNLILALDSLTTTTHNGVTYTVGTDGSIMVNGTVGSNATFSYAVVSRPFPLVTGKYYTLSGCPQNSLDDGKVALILGNPRNGSTIDGALDNGSGVTFKLTTELTGGYVCLIIINGIGTTVENLVFKPQLELGTSATAYTPRVSDISSVSVKKYGKNLIPYPYVEGTSKTMNGITFTVNEDRSITATGTATGNAYFILCKKDFGSKSIGYIQTTNGFIAVSDRLAYNGSNHFTSLEFNVGDGFSGTGTFYPQVELGNAATDYEPYKAPVTYTPDSDGKVSGVTLGSDTATLTTDTDGVIINAKYKKDITKAFAQLEEKINLLSSASTVANVETL